ncbi:MAG: sensor histidine kinase [Lachnospiraceae bacterium]
MKERRIQFIKYVMLIINVITILFVTGFVYYTTTRINDFYKAREFLASVDAIPWKPQMILAEVLFLLCLLVVSFIIREHFSSGNTKIDIITVIIDYFISIIIVILLDFNYNGILFWVFANGLVYIANVKRKLVTIVLLVLSFIATNYDLIAIRINLYSFSDYINFYNANAQQYLFGFLNALTLTNLLLFIMFCALVIQKQRGTIDEVNRLHEQLSDTNEELKAANVQLEKYADIKEKMGQTKERNRLAREIHDTLGHTLTGISAGIDACIAVIDDSPETTKRQLEVISGVTREGINEIRRSVKELRPDALTRFSLEEAIVKMIEDINAMATTRVYFESNLSNLKFDEDEENAIYRVIQESVTNSIRHGHASQIWIRIDKGYCELHINIRDDGIGFKELKKGFGTTHIVERVEMLSGTVSFDGSNGCETKVIIPIRWGETYD